MSAGAWILEYIILTWWFWVSLIPLLAGFVWGFFEWKDGYDGGIDWFFGTFMGAVFSGVLFFAGATAGNLLLPHHDQTSRHELMILRDQSSPTGAFVLGSGSVDGVAAFSFYTQQDGGYNQFEVLKGPNARVYQDLNPDETPWMITFDSCKLWGSIATCFWNTRVINEIHVPPNTIKPTLELDAK